MQPVLQVNIKETKDILRSSAEIADAIRLAKADDGRIDRRDLTKFITPLFNLPEAINGAEKVPAELRDLDQFEAQELEESFGDIINDPRYRKIFYGILLIGDGVQEIIRDEEAS